MKHTSSRSRRERAQLKPARKRKAKPDEEAISLRVSDKVLYPGIGVFTVTERVKKTIGGKSIEFLNLVSVRDAKLKILVPTSGLEQVGLRKLREKPRIDQAYRILKRKRRLGYRSWRERYQDFLDKVNSGSLLEVAEAVSALTQLKSEGRITMREEKLLDKARRLLIGEIAHSLGVPRDAIRAKVDKLLTAKRGKRKSRS